MTNKVNQVVAGIFVCAVSASATASNSTNKTTDSEVSMKLYSDDIKKADDNKFYLPKSDLQKLVPSRDVDQTAGESKKRHTTKSLGDLWDSLWAQVDPAGKQDGNFS